MTGTTEKSEEDAEVSVTHDMGFESTGNVTFGYDDLQNGGNDFMRADSTGLVTGKDKDSDGGVANGKNRPLAVTCTHCRSRKISMYTFIRGNLTFVPIHTSLQSATMASLAVTIASSEE
jgi:hypothetical protein